MEFKYLKKIYICVIYYQNICRVQKRIQFYYPSSKNVLLKMGISFKCASILTLEYFSTFPRKCIFNVNCTAQLTCKPGSFEFLETSDRMIVCLFVCFPQSCTHHTMRTNILNCCNLVSISKNSVLRLWSGKNLLIFS